MKRIFFLILISALLMCNGCNIFKENIISTEIDKTEQDTTDSKYQTLDTDLLDREFLEVGGIELLELGMNEYLSRYTSSEGTFTISGADVTNDFPEELVTMTEILLHDSCNGDREELEKAYEKLANTFGAVKYSMNIEELYLLFPKLLDVEEQPANLEDVYRMLPEIYLVPQHLINIFRISGSNGQEQYIFEYGTGGSNGGVCVSVNDYIDGEFVLVSKFETQNEGIHRSLCRVVRVPAGEGTGARLGAHARNERRPFPRSGGTRRHLRCALAVSIFRSPGAGQACLPLPGGPLQGGISEPHPRDLPHGGELCLWRSRPQCRGHDPLQRGPELRPPAGTCTMPLRETHAVSPDDLEKA